MPHADLFLPDYAVRVSQRAKRLQLRVKSCGQVEVVVPKGVALHHVPGFVAEHEAWLRQTLINTVGRITPPTTITPLLPETITLPAISGEWQVSYHPGRRARVIDHAAAPTAQLQVFGDNQPQQRVALQQWLSQLAKECLIPWLEEVSAEVNLPFAGATVRAQKSRWGSCNSRQEINLNRALLFMSPGAVRYLFIHELCHTVHMNHSARYWALVARLEPEHRHHEAELRRAMAAIPRWALPG
jgi:hypothetical protein